MLQRPSMNFEYETERLILRLPSMDFLRELLEFQMRNRELFEKYEPTRPDNFYTLAYQQSVLKYELKLALKQQTVRFYVFSKKYPQKIIGTVCLHNLMAAPYSCAEVGYKFDTAFQHQGFATEALAQVPAVGFGSLQLHRIFARVMPENIPSVRLLERLGFVCEGMEQECLLIQGKWTNHLRYARLCPAL